MSLPPGPKTSPWLLRMKFNANPFGYMDALTQLYGDVVTISADSTPVVYVSNPQGIKEFFSNPQTVVARGALNRGFIFTTGQRGVLQLDGLTHKNRRKLLMQSFHGVRMQACGHRICELTVNTMEQQLGRTSFVACPTMEDITFQISIEVVLGLSPGERNHRIKYLLTTLLKSDSSLLRKILRKVLGDRSLGRWRPQENRLQLREELFQLLLDEVRERRQQPDTLGPNMLSDLLCACDETGHSLSNEEIRDLLLSPMFAAGDASGTAISWGLYWIHHIPAVRDRILQELDGLGENPDPMSIIALPYLSAVCNEVLRIYPTQLFTFPRLVEAPFQFMGYELSPGTILIGNIYSTHQREDLYPNPKVFKPERFLHRQFSPFEFLPFGGGTRGCIGGAFALYEMKLVLATILSRYQLSLLRNKPEKPRFGGLICYPTSGIEMTVRAWRQGQQLKSLASNSI